MTRLEWERSRKPHEMLKSLGPKLAGRKFQLFLCAAGRRLLEDAPDDTLEKAVRNIERFTDGEIDATDFRIEESRLVARVARERHQELQYGSAHLIFRAIQAVLAADMQHSLQTLFDYGRQIVERDRTADERQESRVALDLALGQMVRDLFPPPDREYVHRPAFAGGGLLLPDGEVFHVPENARLIADGIQQDQAFDRLPILADALEDSDCPDRDWLDHLRYGTNHARGCWALDLVLGRG